MQAIVVVHDEYNLIRAAASNGLPLSDCFLSALIASQAKPSQAIPGDADDVGDAGDADDVGDAGDADDADDAGDAGDADDVGDVKLKINITNFPLPFANPGY